jgi:hypothetical protein
MTVGKGKRPRDPNQLAKWIVDRSTSEIDKVAKDGWELVSVNMPLLFFKRPKSAGTGQN